MAYDGLVTGAMAIHLNNVLAGGRVDKIYQPEKDELLIHIHSKKEKHILYITSNSSHARMHLLKEMKENLNPQNPTAFCMLLRKHIQGGRILNIGQIQSERIIEINIDQRDELGFYAPKKLIVEIMGKHSNIIALDSESGKILDSIKRISSDLNRYRQILPGYDYVSPPGHGKVCFYDVTEDMLGKILDTRKSPLAEALVNGIQGVSPLISEQICKSAVTPQNPNQELLTAKDIYKVIAHITNSLKSGDYIPTVYVNKDMTPMDFHIFPLTDAGHIYEKIIFDNLSDAVEYYYAHKLSSNRIRQKSADLVKALSSFLDRLYLKKQKLLEELNAAENSESYRIYGELLTANLHDIPKGASKAVILNYYDNNEIEIPIEPHLSPAENAQRYFKKYSKSKTAIREKNSQIAETDNSIDYLESVLVYVENADTVDEIEEIRHELAEGGYLRKRKSVYRKSKSKLQPLIFSAGDGSRILVGRNNKENDYLTFKIASKKDLWFHAKDMPGAHVILITDGNVPSEEIMHFAASLASYYSKGRNSHNVPVDYTTVRHVKKTPGAKPGMVIYSNHKTIYATPQKGI